VQLGPDQYLPHRGDDHAPGMSLEGFQPQGASRESCGTPHLAGALSPQELAKLSTLNGTFNASG